MADIVKPSKRLKGHATRGTFGKAALARVEDKYNVIKHLGAGANAEVYSATDLATNTTVALKIFSKKNMDERRKQQFWDEVKLTQRCSHDNILKVVGVHTDLHVLKKEGVLANYYIMALEFGGGGDLFSLIADGKVSGYFHAQRLAFQLLDALNALHQAGVVHRDLKPENILVDSTFGNIKVADFGYAKEVNIANKLNCTTDCGTRAYMAPEILARSKAYDGRKYDVWSSGVIIFLLFCGHPPLAEAKPGDWWFDRLRSLDHTSFWDAHLRKLKERPPEQAMNMINVMLTVAPGRRPLVPDLLEMPIMVCMSQLKQEAEMVACNMNMAMDVKQCPHSDMEVGTPDGILQFPADDDEDINFELLEGVELDDLSGITFHENDFKSLMPVTPVDYCARSPKAEQQQAKAGAAATTAGKGQSFFNSFFSSDLFGTVA
mmetsp:Transcript_39051/g.57398  ORF Transcript_39051/g.57398 Transcript_39051/m.57398 type:complete len:433 (+) Transcript_39051:151-1449(+)